MKFFLIHGEDGEKSYSRLSSFIATAKKRGWEIVFLDESSLGIRENISSVSLFSKERFLVHRNFTKISAKDLKWLGVETKNYSGNLVFYANSVVSRTSISKLPKDTKVEEFKLPQIIWKFLDSFYPGNSKLVLSLLREIQKSTSPEFVFGFLAKHLRDLYWVKVDLKSLAYPSWRLNKLKSQTDKFETGKIEQLIDDLAYCDIQSKTTASGLVSLLDFTIISSLK